MDTYSILRFDMYSFLLGAQISTISGSSLFTIPAPFHLASVGQPQGYLRPSRQGAHSFSYFRVNDPGNLVQFGTKLLTGTFERTIAGGALYQLMEKYLDAKNAGKLNMLFYGQMLGLAFSVRHNFQDGNWLTCGLFAAHLAACGEALRGELLNSMNITADDVIFLIPYSPISFLTGGITSATLALFFTNEKEYTEFITTPDFDEDASNLDIFVGWTVCLQNVLASVVKFWMFVTEKFIVGGVVYCGAEMALKRVTNWSSPSAVIVCSGSVLGLYIGLPSALDTAFPMKRIRRAWGMSFVISLSSYICLRTLQMSLNA